MKIKLVLSLVFALGIAGAQVILTNQTQPITFRASLDAPTTTATLNTLSNVVALPPGYDPSQVSAIHAIRRPDGGCNVTVIVTPPLTNSPATNN